MIAVIVECHSEFFKHKGTLLSARSFLIQEMLAFFSCAVLIRSQEMLSTNRERAHIQEEEEREREKEKKHARLPSAFIPVGEHPPLFLPFFVAAGC